MVDGLYAFLQGIGFHHPLHPAMTHLPVGLVLACFIFSILSFAFSRPDLLRTAYHCCLLAAAGLVLAAATGLLDWLHRYGGNLESLIIIKMVLAPLLLSTLLVAAWQAGSGARAGRMVLLYGLASLFATGLGFAGGELVYGG
ncbi:MAG: hypothetical protein GX087_06525 [Desulfobulbaceae bacterium]|nr:hypothetical protein [Desulfobulbaceae bacterium]